jgi:uncharacterized membrane protein (UPF0127 family)
MNTWWTPLHALVTIGILFGAYLVFHGAMPTSVSTPTSTVPVPVSDVSDVSNEQWISMTIGDTTVRAEVADTEERKQQGLSGRLSLDEGTGMLFVFDRPAYYAFWMPDMYISLDIIWFDASFQIISITEDVTPKSYPESFTPEAPAQYVLEVPAGFSRTHGIAPGMSAEVSGL